MVDFPTIGFPPANQPQAGQKQPSQFEMMQQALAALIALSPVWVDYQNELAKLRRQSYDAHVKAGFSEAEALVLCQTMMFK